MDKNHRTLCKVAGKDFSVISKQGKRFVIVNDNDKVVLRVGASTELTPKTIQSIAKKLKELSKN
jgi:hypothetical protein